MNHILKEIPKLLEQKRKIIVFSHFNYEIKYMSAKLEKEKYRYGIINGSVPPYERDVIIKDMSYDILLIQIIAGGTGLNLQHFNYVFITSPHFNPAVQEQAICRVNRIGQKNETTIRILATEETYEERILEIQEKKFDIINKLSRRIVN